MKKALVFILSLLFISLAVNSRSPEAYPKTGSFPLQRLHVNCLCTNDWIDGHVKNEAEMELRESAANGPLLGNASVKVNDHELIFIEDKQIYRGNIGIIEQWQKIPIHIKTQDGRKVDGYVAVVFMVRFHEPKPFSHVPASHMLPLRWDYSEGSMHTVELLVIKDDVELKALEVPGNTITLNFKRLGLPLTKGDTFRLLVLPFWTSNSELKGSLTNSSGAHFISRASLTIHY